MSGLFTVKTFHGSTLFLNALTRRVVHRDEQRILDAELPFLLQTAELPGAKAVAFALDPTCAGPVFANESGVEPVLLISSLDDGGMVALRNASSNRFISAIPNGSIEVDRIRADFWERFALVPYRTQCGAEVTSLTQTVAIDPGPWSRTLRRLLDGGPSPGAPALVTAIGNLLTMEEVDELVRDLVSDTALSTQLATFFPDDFWAAIAIPALLKNLAPPQQAPASAANATLWKATWRTLRHVLRHPGRAVIQTAPLTQPDRPPPQLIGPERDHLARDGYNGRLASFAHACHAALRLTVQPSKGTAIVATARSEGIYLLEWIAYHRLLGVEAIFLYSNDNDDQSDRLLAALHETGIITWTRSELATGTNAQAKAYGHALNVMLPLLEHRWALLIDIDEFLVLEPTRYSGISDFAWRHQLRETEAVGMNWIMVGSSGQVRWAPAPLTRRNTQLLDDANPHIKVMMSPRHFINAHPHFPFADPRRGYTFRLADGKLHEHRKQPREAYHAKAFSDEPSAADACIHHFFFKSVDEFIWKNARNRGDFPMSHGVTFQSLDRGAAAAFIEQFNRADTRADDRLHRCVPDLDGEIARLRSLPDVYAAEQIVIETFQTRVATLKAELLRSPRLAELGTTGDELGRLIVASMG